MNIFRFILTATICMSSFFLRSQENTAAPKYFVQAKLENSLSKSELNQLKSDLTQNPNVYMVRVDDLNFSLYLITNELNNFNEQSFKSWIINESIYSCYYQGIFSIDAFKPFDEHFCEN